MESKYKCQSPDLFTYYDGIHTQNCKWFPKHLLNIQISVHQYIGTKLQQIHLFPFI